jgi:hypothetical protein
MCTRDSRGAKKVLELRTETGRGWRKQFRGPKRKGRKIPTYITVPLHACLWPKHFLPNNSLTPTTTPHTDEKIEVQSTNEFKVTQ